MRLFMHNMVHASLVIVMAWLAYLFLDDIPTFPSALSYSYMATIATEHTWGLVCLGITLVGATAILSGNWIVRIVTSGVLSVGHIGFAVMFFIGNKHAPASVVFGVYGVLGACLAYSTAHLSERLRGGVALADKPGSLAR